MEKHSPVIMELDPFLALDNVPAKPVGGNKETAASTMPGGGDSETAGMGSVNVDGGDDPLDTLLGSGADAPAAMPTAHKAVAPLMEGESSSSSSSAAKQQQQQQTRTVAAPSTSAKITAKPSPSAATATPPTAGKTAASTTIPSGTRYNLFQFFKVLHMRQIFYEFHEMLGLKKIIDQTTVCADGCDWFIYSMNIGVWID